ncbi:NDP-sugar synthase [Candidatus Latescibacterota bacterium]
MKAVILAAGKGTRMNNITKTIPKPMVQVKGKPMLEHIIELIKTAGITELGIVVGYKKNIVTDYFGDGSDFGVSITYIEQTEQNGTGAALNLAKDFASGEPVFFTFGDVMTTKDNYQAMVDFYETSGCDVVLGLNTVDDPYRGGAVYLDENKTVVKIIEKPPKGTSTTNLNNAGLMVLSADIFDYTARLTLSPRGEYELTDVFNMLEVDGRSIKGYELSGYWKDVGTPEDLEKINKIL